MTVHKSLPVMPYPHTSTGDNAPDMAQTRRGDQFKSSGRALQAQGTGKTGVSIPRYASQQHKAGNEMLVNGHRIE